MHKHLKNTKNKKRSKSFILFGDICGWIGAALILGAYVMVSFNALHGEDLTYQIMNIVGSGLMLILAVARSARPSIFVNTVWIIIGLVAIVNLIINLW